MEMENWTRKHVLVDHQSCDFYTHEILSLLAHNWVMFPVEIQIRWDDKNIQDLPRDKQRGFRHPYQRWSAVPLPHQFLGHLNWAEGVEMQPWGIKDGNGKMTTIVYIYIYYIIIKLFIYLFIGYIYSVYRYR